MFAENRRRPNTALLAMASLISQYPELANLIESNQITFTDDTKHSDFGDLDIVPSNLLVSGSEKARQKAHTDALEASPYAEVNLAAARAKRARRAFRKG